MNDELRNAPVDGVQSKYRDWSANIVNHLLQSNQGWGKVLHIVQLQKEPITYELLH